MVLGLGVQGVQLRVWGEKKGYGGRGVACREFGLGCGEKRRDMVGEGWRVGSLV